MSDGLAELAEWDWVVSPRWSALHHLAAFDDPECAEVDWGGPGTTTCGLRAKWVHIPGLFSRMGAPRCRRCCKALGWPQGVGSPKNDPELHPLVEARLVTA